MIVSLPSARTVVPVFEYVFLPILFMSSTRAPLGAERRFLLITQVRRPLKRYRLPACRTGTPLEIRIGFCESEKDRRGVVQFWELRPATPPEPPLLFALT